MIKMCQNSYSFQTAKTGIVTISTANTNLDGTGALGTVMAGGAKGTKVNFVKIVAIANTAPGMIRLFVGDNISAYSLIAEIPVSTSNPSGTIASLEMSANVSLDIPPGYYLYASTQNAQTFNVFAEGMEWDYPEELPTECCNFKQETAVIGLATVSVANPNRNGSGTIVPVFTVPDTNGATIDSIQVSSLQATTEGMIRLFLSPDGVNFSLFQEIWIPPSAQSGTIPSYKTGGNVFSSLQGNYVIGVSTQNAEYFAITINGTSWEYAV